LFENKMTTSMESKFLPRTLIRGRMTHKDLNHIHRPPVLIHMVKKLAKSTENLNKNLNFQKKLFLRSF
jgi:hypothetical protein